MSLKNLRKNTQLIKYLKKLYKRTKKVDIIDDFAVSNADVPYVYQPCLRAKVGGGTTPSQEMQTKCADGWTSEDENNPNERLTKCRQNPTAADSSMPECDTLERVSYRNPHGFGSDRTRDVNLVFEQLLRGSGHNSLSRIINKSLSSLWNEKDELKYNNFKSSILNIRKLMKLDNNRSPITPPNSEFNTLDSEAKKEFILTQLDTIKEHLVPSDAAPMNILKLHILQELLLEVHAPQQADTAEASKARFERESSKFFELEASAEKRSDLPLNKLVSAIPEFLKTVITDETVFQNAFLKAKSKQKGFFEIKVPSDMFKGSPERGISSSIIHRFGGINTELQTYLRANPQISTQTREDITFYDQSFENLKGLFDLQLFEKDVTTVGPSDYEQYIPDNLKRATEAQIPDKADDQTKARIRKAAIKKYMTSMFNQRMSDFNTAISKISKIDAFAGFDYVRPKFVEFQASIVKLLNDKTIAAYVPKDTNYPYSDVEYDTEDESGGSSLRLFSTSVKSGWKANVGSITALVGVKFFGENASPRAGDHISRYGTYSPNREEYTQGHRFYEALTSDPTDSLPALPGFLKLDKASFNFRREQNHTLFIRPGMELSVDDLKAFKGKPKEFRDKYLYFATDSEIDDFIKAYTEIRIPPQSGVPVGTTQPPLIPGYESLNQLLEDAAQTDNSFDHTFKVENALMVLTAMKLRHAYNSRLDTSIVSKGTNLRELLTSSDTNNKALATGMLKDLKSGLNYHPDTFDTFLSGMFDEYLETVNLADLVDIAQLHAKANGELLSNIPTGAVGSMLLLNFYANLGTFDGDTQFTSLTQSVDGSRSLNQIKDHFDKAEKTSLYAERGLYKQCELNKDQKLGMSAEDYVSRVTSDFLLNPDLVEDLKAFIQRPELSDFESLTGAQVRSLTQEFTTSLQSEDNTIYIETPVNYKTIVGGYVRTKEKEGNYAAVGIKTSPHETAGYAVNLFDAGITSGHQSREQLYLEYENKIERHHQFIQELLDTHVDTFVKNNTGASTFSETRKNPLLKQFYKRLLKKTISFADDGVETVIQPCAHKDSEGKITGVGSYERKRACYNGWTSIGTGAHANSCMPSNGSSAGNFKYPTCPKPGAEPDDSDSTLGGRIAMEVSNNPKFQTEEGFGNLLDAIGANIYKRALENPSHDKVNETEQHLNYLQAFQKKLLDKVPLEDIKNAMQDIEDYEMYIFDLEEEGKEPTPEELEKFDANKYLYYKYETYLENSSARVERERMFKARQEKEKSHRKLLMKMVKDGRKDKLYNPKAIQPTLDKTSLKYFYKSSYGDSFIEFDANDITGDLSMFDDLKPIRGLLQEKKAKMVIDISFLVNGSYGMPEEALTRLEKLEAAQVLQRVFEDTIKRAPVGAVFVNHPYEMDSPEAHIQRINNYKTMGFDLLDQDHNTMTAIKTKDGSITPLNTQNMKNFKEKPKPNYETLFDAFFGSSSATHRQSNKKATQGGSAGYNKESSSLFL